VRAIAADGRFTIVLEAAAVGVRFPRQARAQKKQCKTE